MKPTFPIPYAASIERLSVGLARIEAGERPAITGGPPPEFSGGPTAWSPEHLLLSALGLCLFTTFEAYAAREKLTVISWRDTASGTLDRTSSGLAFTAFALEVDLEVAAGEEAKAREVFDKAKRSCIVSRALNPAPTAVLRVEVVRATA